VKKSRPTSEFNASIILGLAIMNSIVFQKREGGWGEEGGGAEHTVKTFFTFFVITIHTVFNNIYSIEPSSILSCCAKLNFNER
jgi:hypothetical protein